MAYAHSKNCTITVNSVTYPFKQASVSQKSANAETTNFLTSGDFDSIAGIKSAVISGQIIADPTATAYGTSTPVFGEGVSQTVIITWGDGTTSKSGTFIVRWDSVDFNFDVADKVGISVSGTGKLTSRWA